MGYTDDPAMVRVDFFKESGKWYCTEAVKWTGKYKQPDGVHPTKDDGWDINAQFAKSLRDHFKDRSDRLSNMDAVCLEPYHENAFPLMLRKGSWRTR